METAPVCVGRNGLFTEESINKQHPLMNRNIKYESESFLATVVTVVHMATKCHAKSDLTNQEKMSEYTQWNMIINDGGYCAKLFLIF